MHIRTPSGLVDNFSGPVRLPSLPLHTVHFGDLLHTLRTQRGLTQAQLAEKAGVTDATIRRAEKKPDCSFYAQTARTILDALEAVSPLTHHEWTLFTTATGMNALLHPSDYESASRFHQLRDARSELRAREAGEVHQKKTSAEAQTAHDWINKLIEQAGAARMLTALEGIAIAWGVELPRRVETSDLAKRPMWRLTHQPEDKGEGWEVQRHSPIDTSKIPPAKHEAPAARRKAQ